ncbi:MAG: hypothetical protein Q7R93_05485 [bacterium]|nr:hypothetical protein [bacterium]
MKIKNALALIVIVVLALIALALWSKGTSEAPYADMAESKTETPAEKTPAVPVKSPAVKRAEAAYTQTRVLENGRYISIVSLTDKGFVPQVVSINRGENVRFVNKTSGSMRIASEDFEGVALFAGLNQEKTVGKSGIYELTMPEAGVWAYYNLSKGGSTGVVYVK